MRRKHDFYPTPEFATLLLLRYVPDIRGSVLECCAGDRAIADCLPDACEVWTNDIDQSRSCHFAFDAAKDWPLDIVADWVITNPPFNQAAQIVPLAFEHAAHGIAMLLRLSYLEPVEDRGAWLNEHPPSTLIVLPRISFTGNGKTDSVTCAWMVWDKRAVGQQIIVAENPRFATKVETESLFATA